MERRDKPPVCLEDLLKIKRLEQPDAEFWDQFESEFQHRRLKALMESGGGATVSTWSRFSRSMYLLFPAAAVLALGVALWRPDSGGALHVGETQDFAVQTDTKVEYPDPNEHALPSSSIAAVVTSSPSPHEISIADQADFHFAMDVISPEQDRNGYRKVSPESAIYVPRSTRSQFFADTLKANASPGASFAAYRGPAQF